MLLFYLTMLAQQSIASSTHLFAKTVTHTVHPAVVVLFRSAFAVLFYCVWIGFRRSLFRKIDRSDWRDVVILGLINIPINQLLFIWSLRYTTPPNAALAYALTPTFVVILERVLRGITISKKQSIGIFLALFGTIIIQIEKGISLGSEVLLGNCMVLAASISWAMFTTKSKPMAEKYGAIFSTGMSMLSGLLLYIPLFFLFAVTGFNDVHFVPQAITQSEWGQIAYLGIMTSGVGYGLWNYALTKAKASKVAIFNNLQPILTTIMSFVIFGLEPTLVFIVGGTIALIGVVYTQRGKDTQ